jgi:hypothetical protein
VVDHGHAHPHEEHPDMWIRKFIVATTVAAGGLTMVTSGAAGASTDAEAAVALLDELCEARGGMPVNSPYSIARCQGARVNKGFNTERLICEGLADGELIVTISARHMNRASWGCFATSLAA